MERRRPGDRILDSVERNWQEWVEGEERGFEFEKRRHIEILEIRDDQGLADMIDDRIEKWVATAGDKGHEH